LDRKLGETQSRSGRGGEEKNSQPLPGERKKRKNPPPPEILSVQAVKKKRKMRTTKDGKNNSKHKPLGRNIPEE
jgi:hypothetical protein